MGEVDLLQFFTSFSGSSKTFKHLIKALRDVDPTVGVLALEGLYRIESNVNSKQFQVSDPEDMRKLLRKWRSKSLIRGAYGGVFKRVPNILKNLTIFKEFEVPLFIDDYGEKKLLNSYEKLEDIDIRGDTPIFHVTHRQEADGIAAEKRFIASEKNTIEGCWFGLHSEESVYGSYAFETTLRELRVTGLHQGEIVYYKQEVNVILYAVDDKKKNFKGLEKPTGDAVKKATKDPGAYVKVSIFVPSQFLPEGDEFSEVIRGPSKITHGPFCLKKKRSFGDYNCRELRQPLIGSVVKE